MTKHVTTPCHVLRRVVLPLLLLATGIASAGDPERGAVIYFEHGCYGCHGYNGTGRTPLVNNVSGMLVNEDVFIAFLRQREDQNPVLPANSMPNFGVYALGDEDARHVYAYLRTLVDEPPAVEDIAVFQQLLDASERPYEDDERP